MSNVVVKPFKTVNRKFKPAGPGESPVYITAADIDPGSVFSLQDWIDRGFVKVEESYTPAPVSAYVASAPAPTATAYKSKFSPTTKTDFE